MKKHTLRLVDTYEKPFTCEDCGTCYPEGLYIEFNGEVVWEKFSDGHYSGHQTEDSIVNSILNKWYLDQKALHEINKSEEKRLEWDKEKPRSSIAKTQEGWIEHQNELFSFITDSVETIKQNCENLPYDEKLQARMIALWFEAETGESFDIVESTEKYKN